MSERTAKAALIEPVLLLRTEKLPEGPGWLVELKFDGYRARAIKDGGEERLRSRNNKDFTSCYPAIVKALAAMPDRTVIDGEIVPRSKLQARFGLLQHYGSAGGSLYTKIATKAL